MIAVALRLRFLDFASLMPREEWIISKNYVQKLDDVLDCYYN